MAPLNQAELDKAEAAQIAQLKADFDRKCRVINEYFAMQRAGLITSGDNEVASQDESHASNGHRRRSLEMESPDPGKPKFSWPIDHKVSRRKLAMIHEAIQKLPEDTYTASQLGKFLEENKIPVSWNVLKTAFRKERGTKPMLVVRERDGRQGTLYSRVELTEEQREAAIAAHSSK